MTFKMIATDVDGTLIDDRQLLSEENIAAIKKARAHGIRVILCSGRSPGTMLGYETQLGLLESADNYGIGFNGATVYRTTNREVLAGHTIAKETAAAIVERVRALSSEVLLGAYLDDHNVIAQEPLRAIMEKYREGTPVINHYYPEITGDMFTKDPLNVYLVQYREKLLPIYEALQKEPFPGVRLSFTQPDLLEFMPESMNKAQGLQALAKHLGLAMHEIVTVGDNYNDMEMLQAAGYGVAVANAVPELKEMADHVTRATNSQSALAEVVELVIEMNRG